MSSSVEICNMALRNIGAKSITSITSPTNQLERDCQLFYTNATNSVLRDRDWTFARRRKALTSFTIPDDYEGKYNYAYTLPADCLKPRHVYDEDGYVPQKYELMRMPTGELVILTDTPNAVLRYTMVVSDSSWFDEEFVDALAVKLASKLAIPVAKSKALEKQWGDKYLGKINEAILSDSEQHYPKKEEDEVSWITSRTAY